MIRKIDWKVYSNNKLIIDNNNVKCNLYSSNIIEFKDEYGKHIIDLENKTYSKVGNDNKMVIDFIAKTCEFIFEKNEKCTFDIDCNIKIKENHIEILYSFDEDEKKILIELK